MVSHRSRPRRLVIATLILAGLTFGLAVRALIGAGTPAGVTHVPAWFDVTAGIAGGMGLAWAVARLWQSRRDGMAAGLALAAWGALAALIALRAALFVQADYERGRLPFLALAAATLLGAAGIIAARKRWGGVIN